MGSGGFGRPRPLAVPKAVEKFSIGALAAAARSCVRATRVSTVRNSLWNVLRDLESRLEGFVVRDGVRVHYQVFGAGGRTILLLPTWSVVHSGIWARQVPHLVDRYTVVTFDGRGNGSSDRPTGPATRTRTGNSQPTRWRCSTPSAPPTQLSSRCPGVRHRD